MDLNIGRPGMKTSEYWIALVSCCVAVVATCVQGSLPWQAVVVVVSYILSRTFLKMTVAKNGGG